MALYSNFYYHGILRKHIVAFGSLFDEIQVVRFKPDGTEANRQTVPISYGPKEKWVRRVTEDPDASRNVAAIWPLMSYEMVGFNYAADRKTGNTLKQSFTTVDKTQKSFVFSPVPYDFIFNLYLITKSEDEAMQVCEQILPMFTPDVVLTVKTVPQVQIKDNISVSISSTTVEDSWDGSLADNRRITWTFSFIMKGYLYGPIRKQGPITKVITRLGDFGLQDGNFTSSPVPNIRVEVRERQPGDPDPAFVEDVEVTMPDGSIKIYTTQVTETFPSP